MTELHISGRIDSFLFGVIKEPYFQELKNSNQTFKDLAQGKNVFLEAFFLLFLENNFFSDKSNLETFNEIVDIEKLKVICPNFYKIYETTSVDSVETNEITRHDDEVHIKTSVTRSDAYDYYSFLEEILDSPNFTNKFRVFSTENYVELYSNGEKIEESTLEEFLQLEEATFDEDYEFIYSDRQNDALNKFVENKISYPKFDLRPIAITNRRSIQYDGFWPNDFFKFVLGNDDELLENHLYGVMHKHYQYDREREVRVKLSNVSKCIFSFEENIDFEKLMFLRCGLDLYSRLDTLNYTDDINLFNYIAYDGELLVPEETIFRDKGIEVKLVEIKQDDNMPDFCLLFID